MLTGTTLDLTPFGVILQGIGWLYWLFVITALGFVVFKIKGRTKKIVCIVLVLGITVTPTVYLGWKRYQHEQVAKAKLDVAMARFNELCKNAGEKIYRTVDDVEGIQLLNIRGEDGPRGMSNPIWPDAGLLDESGGEWYIRNFLMWEHHEDKRSLRGYLNEDVSELPGYQYVDVTKKDGTTLRYQFIKSNGLKLSLDPIQGQLARYAVSYVNHIDPDDRKKWIAGTTVFITDTLSKEKIAEKTWYVVDRGQGSTAGFRAPWGYAQMCPNESGHGMYATRFFVDQMRV